MVESKGSVYTEIAYENIAQQLILYKYTIGKKITMKKAFALLVYTVFL